MRQKKVLEAQAASCPAARPVHSSEQSSPKVRNRICGEMAHQGGNHGIINEKQVIHVFLQPATNRLLLPLYFFLHTCMHELGPACRQPSLREKDLSKTKSTPTTSSTVFRRKETQKPHKVDRAHSGWSPLLPHTETFPHADYSFSTGTKYLVWPWLSHFMVQQGPPADSRIFSLLAPLQCFWGRDLLSTQTALCKKKSCIFLRHRDAGNRFFFLSSMMDQCHMQ